VYEVLDGDGWVDDRGETVTRVGGGGTVGGGGGGGGVGEMEGMETTPSARAKAESFSVILTL
jgi:hypothetical protein